MPPSPPSEIPWQTPSGPVTVQAFCPPEKISGLDFDASLKPYARYKPLLSNKENLVSTASQPDNNVTLVYTPERLIVGVGVLEHPAPEERWSRVGQDVMMEASVIEVAADRRAAGLAKKILEALLQHPSKERCIIYMVGYSWTWDLEGTGLSPIRYREVLIRLFAAFGFRTYPTNEPNVLLRPENLFMARVGSEVSEELQKRFKWVRFDLDRYMEQADAHS